MPNSLQYTIILRNSKECGSTPCYMLSLLSPPDPSSNTSSSRKPSLTFASHPHHLSSEFWGSGSTWSGLSAVLFAQTSELIPVGWGLSGRVSGFYGQLAPLCCARHQAGCWMYREEQDKIPALRHAHAFPRGGTGSQLVTALHSAGACSISQCLRVCQVGGESFLNWGPWTGFEGLCEYTDGVSHIY